jgi:hypothetical protein
MHKYDLILHYSSKDNIVIEGNDKGWVTNFERFLGLVLEQFIGRKPLIAKSSLLSSSELSNAEMMVCVLSPSFSKDKFCLEILNDFVEVNTTLKKSVPKIFKVTKSPVKTDHQPEILKDLLEYDFYHINTDTEQAEEINKFFGKEAEKFFWLKLVDLVYDIHSIINKKSELSEELTVRKEKKENYIFLAETGNDLSAQRSIIKRELQSHGYKVLPESSLDNNKGNLAQKIKSDLSRCKLSIHMIGQSYVDYLKEESLSLIELQNRLAVEHHQQTELQPNNSFYRMIWIAPGLIIKNEKQKAFIEGLKRDAETVRGAEILQIPIEDFKNIVRKQLMDLSLNISFDPLPFLSENQKIVYLVYDKVDKRRAQDIKDELTKEGLFVIEPTFEGNLLHLRQQHIDHLKKCDMAVIFQEELNEHWVKMKILDIVKAPGFGRVKPFTFKGISFYKGEVSQQSYFKNFGIDIIDLNKNSLMDFIMHSNKK